MLKIVPGMQFANLQVLRRGALTPSGEIRWYCRCSCESETLVRSSHLRVAHTTSCGCKGRPVFVKGKEYSAWAAMRQRCSNPNSPGWEHYGGRGISVSPVWDKFQKFLEDVGPAPSRQHSLDRVDVDGNYEPGNVRWATSREQALNRRCTQMLTFRGECKPLSVWADERGIPRGTLQWRIAHEWDVDKALTTPARTRRRRKIARATLLRRAEAKVASARQALQEAERQLIELEESTGTDPALPGITP
jgi:hypothetical protein